MQLHEFKCLSQELTEFRIADGATAVSLGWQAPRELMLLEENEQLYLSDAQQLTPVEPVSWSVLRATGASRLWCVKREHKDRLWLASCLISTELSLDLSIGVDDRIAQQLEEHGYSAGSIEAACAWLQEEFLLSPMLGEGSRAIIRAEPRSRTPLTIVGRRYEIALREEDSGWRLIRMRPAAGERGALSLLTGDLQFVDFRVASKVRSASQRQQLQELVDDYGDYIGLWQQYSDAEWERATDAGRELGAFRFQQAKLVGEAHWDYCFQGSPDSVQGFQERWNTLEGTDRHQGALLEVSEDLPAWLANRIEAERSGKPLLGKVIRFEQGGVVLRFDEDKRHSKIPASGVLTLGVHGERKVRERRDEALELVTSLANPMPQLRFLLEGHPAQIRKDWRRLRALSQGARAAFHGEPTDKQRRALEVALNTPDIAVIIGPPGTGKTQVISALQQRLAEEFKQQNISHQLLISSYQHDAVDNALSRTRVFGLPPLKVGRRGRAEEESGDTVASWCAERRNELVPVLEQELEKAPAFKRLESLRSAVIRLRIEPLELNERRLAAQEIDARLRVLGEADGIRPSAGIATRWSEWLNSLGSYAFSSGARDPRDAVIWRRTLRGLRVTGKSFADDGRRQCSRVLDCSKRVDAALDADERALLQELSRTVSPEQAQLRALAELKDRRLDASLPDYRPPAVRRSLTPEACALLDKLMKELDDQLRQSRAFGELAALSDYLEDLRLSPKEVEDAVKAYTSVLGATCQQSAGEVMNRLLEADGNAGTFDTVVVDEAARATPLDLLIPLSKARRRIILVGDHRQLPHLLDPKTEAALDAGGKLGEKEKEWLEQSIFERLVRSLRRLEREEGQPQRVVMLDTQFRMHPTLGDFVSRTFYETYQEDPVRSGLPAERFSHDVPGYEDKVCAWLDVPAGDTGDRDTSFRGSRRRALEAERIVAEAVRVLRECPDLSIGIISFYSAQRDLILELLAEQGVAEPTPSGFQIRREWQYDESGSERFRVGTVDSFQGKEFDVVLLSLVRTDRGPADPADDAALTRKYGFLRLSNRLNVAMSRQRRLLITVGDAALARAPEAKHAAPGLAEFMKLCEGGQGCVR